MDPHLLTTARILVVDDEEANVDLLEQMLARAGYTNVAGTTDARRVLTLYRERQPDLILLDLLMPHLDGFAVMAQLAPEIPEHAYLPILVLTADITPAAKQRALSVGAKDFLTKPFDHTELLLRIRNLLETRFLHLRLQHHNQALERLYEEAVATLRMRDESLSAITHDLGQPLASIRVAARVLRQQAENRDAATAAQLAEELAGIDDATTKMWAMLGELLDVARLDAGRPLDLHWQATDLVALVHHEAAVHQRTTERHHIRIEAAVPELVVEIDPLRLQRVLANLLANAIKYSPSGGGIVVTVARESDEPVLTGGTRSRPAGAAGRPGSRESAAHSSPWSPTPASRAVIAVRDEGIGIPAADLPLVFERFHRAANVAGRVGGTGVGLATARRIVEQHGGTISVESTEGRGTTFTVSLPL